LKQQLQLFAEGLRGGSQFSELMDHAAVHSLLPDEMDAVARFYAGE